MRATSLSWTCRLRERDTRNPPPSLKLLAKLNAASKTCPGSKRYRLPAAFRSKADLACLSRLKDALRATLKIVLAGVGVQSRLIILSLSISRCFADGSSPTTMTLQQNALW